MNEILETIIFYKNTDGARSRKNRYKVGQYRVFEDKTGHLYLSRIKLIRRVFTRVYHFILVEVGSVI